MFTWMYTVMIIIVKNIQDEHHKNRREKIKWWINLPKPQVEAGEDRTNSMHLPHSFLSSCTITGKHSGCVTLSFTDLQHEIAVPLCPVNHDVFVNKV